MVVSSMYDLTARVDSGINQDQGAVLIDALDGGVVDGATPPEDVVGWGGFGSGAGALGRSRGGDVCGGCGLDFRYDGGSVRRTTSNV